VAIDSGRRVANLGISRQVAVLVALVSALLTIGALGISMLVFGVSQETVPVIATLVGTLGISANGLISALKSTEAADTASKTQQVAELTASKAATIEQLTTAHCGEICPSLICPLRRPGGTAGLIGGAS
jgi:hypothetical protein